MAKNTKIVLLIGAPSTGKTSVIDYLKAKGHLCFEEISRQVIQEARLGGIEHLFQSEPLLFSKKLLEGRINQFIEAKNASEEIVFIDRGLPDVTAYLDMVETSYGEDFINANKKYKYDTVFWFPIWENIYKEDKERYENLELAKKIEEFLLKAYKALGYEIIEVPKTSIENRADFILKHSKLK